MLMFPCMFVYLLSIYYVFCMSFLSEYMAILLRMLFTSHVYTSIIFG